jgi:hypothetical protein
MHQEHTTVSYREAMTILKQAYGETWQHQVGKNKHHTDLLRNLDRKESTIIYSVTCNELEWQTLPSVLVDKQNKMQGATLSVRSGAIAPGNQLTNKHKN